MNSRHSWRTPYGVALVCTILVQVARSSPLPLPPSITCSQQNGSNLCCRPAKWTDILVFYIGNYLAHAVTTRSLPGESVLGAAFAILAALMFPMSGAIRGIRAISSGAIFADTELQIAARAGALCMVGKAPSNVNREGWSRISIFDLAETLTSAPYRRNKTTHYQNPRLLSTALRVLSYGCAEVRDVQERRSHGEGRKHVGQDQASV
jgi:hypothetical protein